MSDDLPDLGPCCCCEQQSDTVRNIVLLPYKTADTVGHGWGCVVCGLPPDGASYVACDACLEAHAKPRWIIVGYRYPAQKRRQPVPEAPEAHDHDDAKHDAFDAWQEALMPEPMVDDDEDCY